MKRFLNILFIGLLGLGVFSCNNKKAAEEEPVHRFTTNNNPDSIPIPETNDTPYSLPDISPMDMCYFPVDYPKLKMAKATISPLRARVIYSRPHLQGRHLFENILKYGEAWRLGANESTELDLYSDAAIQGKKIKAGRYVLYCIPDKDQWTIVFNTNIDSWGLEPDSTKDVARFTIPAREISHQLEYLTMLFIKTQTGADLVMAWDKIEARLPFSFN